MPLIFFLFLASRPEPAFAQLVSLDDAISQTLGESGQLKAQRHLVELSSGDRRRRFLPREPQFQFSSSDDGSSESYALTLTTSFPGKSIAYGELDRAKFESDRAELAAKRHELAKLVVQSYLDCAVSRAVTGLQRQAVEDFTTLAHSLRTLYENGKSTQAEKIGAELQYRQVEADLAASEDRVAVTCRKWRESFGAGQEPADIPDDLRADTLAELGVETSDQMRSQATLRIAHANRALRWWAQAPDLTWGVARNHYLYAPASPSGKEWASTFSVALTLPLFFPFSESVEADRLAVQAALDQSASELQSWAARADAEDAAKELVRDKRRLHQLKDQDLPLAEALVESTYAAYKTGKLGFAELIQSRKTLFDLKAQEVQTRAGALGARLRCLGQCEALAKDNRAMERF